MKKTRTTEITFETDELFIVRRRDRSTNRRCETCGAQVQMLTLAEAAAITRTSDLAIRSRIDSRVLHSTETLDGQVLICLNSLLNDENIAGGSLSGDGNV